MISCMFYFSVHTMNGQVSDMWHGAVVAITTLFHMYWCQWLM